MSETAVDRRVRWSASGVLALGLGLRVWNLHAGLPYAVGVDEPQLVDRAVRMMRTGDFHPHFFDYPGLYIYLQLAVAVATFIAGAMTGAHPTLETFSGADLFPVARAVTALFGVATVAVTMRIGMRYGTRVALVGGLLLAVMPMHVRESHYVLTDVPMTFFVTLTLLLSLRAHEVPTCGRFAAAGVAAGLAAATKYNGGMAIILPLLVVAFQADRRRSAYKLLGATIGVSAAAYLLAAPFTVLDLPAFLTEFARLNAEYRAPGRGPAPWITYLKHLRINFGTAAIVAILAGLVTVGIRTVRGTDRVVWLLLLVFPAAHFALLSGRSLVFGRYLLPLLPMLCLVAGAGIVALWDGLSRWARPRVVAAVMTAAIAAVLAVPATLSVRFNLGLSMPTTRQAAYSWLMHNVPKATALAIELGAMNLAGDRYAIMGPRRIIDHSLDEYRSRGVRYLVTTSERSRDAEAAYREYFAGRAPVFVSAPSRRRSGPEVRIYAVGDRP
jgi:4-amino-4-deoxy-L-arabinose transferase-like glycosyltransferase